MSGHPHTHALPVRWFKPVQSPEKLNGDQLHEHCRSQQNDPYGRNPFIRLSLKDGDPNSTDASYWRIIFSPAGPGHVLYLKSELTEGRWRIHSDNIAMARWLRTTVQGMLNAELSDTTIPCAEATFSKAGDPRYFWTEYIKSHSEDISLTWFDIGEPLLIHSQPNQIPNRRYGVCTVLIPSARHAPRPQRH